MNNAVRQPLWRLLVAVIILCAAWGCFEYKEVITIEDDGSGTLEVNATIAESISSKFLDDDLVGDTPAPVREGVVRNLLTGSSGVKVESVEIDLLSGVWTYNIRVSFDNVKSLARTKYFKERNLIVTYSSAKELHLKQDIFPSLVAMAKDQATILSDDVYSGKYLEAVDTTAFEAMVSPAKMTYVVVMPGIDCVYSGPSVIEANNKMRATRDLTMGDFYKTTAKQKMDILATLPPERGFTPVVVLLLLGSLIGILVPAIRLLVTKMRGTT